MNTPVLILHGWAYDTAKWQPVLDGLEAIGISARLLHVPGLTTEVDKPLTIDDYVAWLDSEVGSGPVVLIGHSNGGRIILNYAIKHTEKVKQLILIDSAGIPRRELHLRVKRGVSKTIAKVGKRIVPHPAARRLLYKVIGERDYHDASPVMRETMANLLQSDNVLDPSLLSVSTTIIWGSEDKTTPLKDAHTLQKQIKGSKLTVVNGARHSPQFTDTSEVVKVIREALNGNL